MCHSKHIISYILAFICCGAFFAPQQVSAQISSAQVFVSTMPVIDSVSYSCTGTAPIQVHVANPNASMIYSIESTVPSVASIPNNNTGTFPVVNGITSAVFRVYNGSCYSDRLIQFDCAGNPLPLDLLKFNVRLHNANSAMIIWEVNDEPISIQKFELEKSEDGRTFNYLSTINAKPTVGINNYEYLDKHLFTGYNYYRLKIIGNDGHVTYSDIRFVINKKEQSLVWYPNPTSKFVYLEFYFDGNGGMMDIAIFNVVSGLESLKRKQTLVKGFNKIAVDVSSLSDATYFMRYQMSNGEQGAIQFQKITQ